MRAEQLGKRFSGDAPTLDDLNFTVAPGEFTALLGPSGCGKSTLLRLIAGLDTPTTGRLTLTLLPAAAASMTRPENLAASSQYAVRAAFVFQEPGLLPWRTVAGNIALPLELQGMAARERSRLVAENLKRIGLTGSDAAKFPRQLSGGMRMRVSLARALVTHPHLLLLDEPFAALDDILRSRLNEELQRLWLQERFTALFVTHNVAEAAFLAERIVVLSRSPLSLAATFTVPFPLPRSPELKTSSEFAAFVRTVNEALRPVTAVTVPPFAATAEARCAAAAERSEPTK